MGQLGEKLVADAVAGMLGAGIAGILAEGDAVAGGVIAKGGAGEVEQRTHEEKVGVDGRGVGPGHAGEAVTAGAAKEAEEEEFGLVVGVVGEGDHPAAGAGGGAGEKLVAGEAGGHFRAVAGEFGVLLVPPGFLEAGQAEFLRRGAGEGGVGVAGVAAEAVVEVGDGELPAVVLGQAVEQVEQDHGIGAAGDGNEDGLARRQELPRSDRSRNLLAQIHDGGMLGSAAWQASAGAAGATVFPVDADNPCIETMKNLRFPRVQLRGTLTKP